MPGGYPLVCYDALGLAGACFILSKPYWLSSRTWSKWTIYCNERCIRGCRFFVVFLIISVFYRWSCGPPSRSPMGPTDSQEVSVPEFLMKNLAKNDFPGIVRTLSPPPPIHTHTHTYTRLWIRPCDVLLKLAGILIRSMRIAACSPFLNTGKAQASFQVGNT